MDQALRDKGAVLGGGNQQGGTERKKMFRATLVWERWGSQLQEMKELPREGRTRSRCRTADKGTAFREEGEGQLCPPGLKDKRTPSSLSC